MALFALAAAAHLAATPPEGEPGIELAPLADKVWVHSSYLVTGRWGPIPSNGLVVETGEGRAVLVDTAWTVGQTARLLEKITGELGLSVEAAVVTHAHNDKMGGMNALHTAGVTTFAHPMTNLDAPGRNLIEAEHDLSFSVDGDAETPAELEGISIFYPGPGHTRDNIVVGVDGTGIVFGGCLVRPAGARDLGNIADGDVGHWDDAAKAVAKRFPDAETVVPSHGRPGGFSLLTQTADLASKAQADTEE